MSDVGTVRTVNEDSCLESPGMDGGFWVVADGMGGHEAGEIASQMVVASLSDMLPGNNLGGIIDDAEDRLLQVNGHGQLCDMAAQSFPPKTIGTTVVALLAFRRQGAFIWAGDSRAYLLRDGAMSQLTRDHTEIAELMHENNLTEDEALAYTTSNVITRAVGGEPNLRLDVKFQELCPADRYMLCSDGLYNAVSEPEIAALLAAGEPAVVVNGLIQRALEMEARDNVTVIVIDFHDM
jgi:protein phosphatase